MRGNKKILTDERGIILVLSLMILTLLMGAGVGAIVSMQTDLRTSGNLKTGMQALYIADAGISHARREMQEGVRDFDSVFSSADGSQIVSNSSFNGGSYSVTRQGSASSPSRVKALAVGTAPSNARVEIEAWFRKDAGRPSKAIESNGDLRISGNPRFMGSCSGAHANEDMKIDGSPGIQMSRGLTVSHQAVTKRGFEVAQGMEITGTPCIGSPDCSNPFESQPEAYKLDTVEKRDSYISGHNSEPLHSMPKIDPADYAAEVAEMGPSGSHYILHDDGSVTTGGSCRRDGLCRGGTSAPIPAGWSFSAGMWKVTGNSAANGVFYSEVKVEIAGSPGSASLPWETIIIARDSVRVAGSPHIKPYATASDKLKNHLLVTGNDLEISGDVRADYTGGAILVHQQFKISSDQAKIHGFVLSGDGLPTWSGDPFPPSASSSGVALNEISGSPTITYKCDFGCSGPGCPPTTVVVASWTQKL